MPEPAPQGHDDAVARWGKVIDHEKCIGCHACTTACKSENDVPLSVTRTFVKYVDVGTFPNTRRNFQVTRCNQCDDSPCTTACPTSAMFRRPDGIVDFDKNACIGCKACIAACPYDAIFINPEDHTAEKCNFCAHRLDVGLEPACVTVCPTEAILVGDLEDPGSRVSEIVHRQSVAVRRPEKETHPKLFYKGAHQATLDPLAARRPKGGLFLWSQQKQGPKNVVGGNAKPSRSQAAAVLAYDVPHKMPWDWRVSLYTLTKGIAAGAYLVPLLLLWTGQIAPTNPLWTWAAPLVGGLFLALTGLLLIWDLDQPKRFYYIFTRPQWKSWLVRGAFVIAGYSLVLGLHVAANLLDAPGLQRAVGFAGLPLAVMTAIYTAYLFAQAKARDLWQSPLLPPHLLVQTLLAGAAILVPVAVVVAPDMLSTLLGTVVVTAVLHLLMVLGEITLTHGTAHARVATWEMTGGRYRGMFWGSVVAMVVAIALGVLAGTAVAPVLALIALVGLAAYEHAYVQAAQAVPLA